MFHVFFVDVDWTDFHFGLMKIMKTMNISTPLHFPLQATSIIGTIGLITSNVLTVTNPTMSYAILVYSLLLFSVATWALLFIPKLYIALVKSDRNNVDLMKRAAAAGDYDAYEEDGSSYLSMIDRPLAAQEMIDRPSEVSMRE